MNKDSKLKIIQINALGSTQSTGRSTRQMHEYFIEQGLESYIVCPTNLDCEDAYFISSRFQMKLDVLMTMITGLEGYHSILPTVKLISFIKKTKPNIVHLGILHSNYVNVPILLRYLGKNNIPTVITLHDFWYLTGICCHYTSINCNKWQSGCNNCPIRNKMPRPLLFDRTSKMWKDKYKYLSRIKKLAVIAVSEWEKDEVKKSPLAQNAIIRRIYNWIDLETFYPKNTNIRNKLHLDRKFVILSVSTSWSNGDRKGFDYYLELANNMPDNYHIVLIGKINSKVTLPKDIIAIGECKDASVLAEYYSMADVYLNLSKEETFGKVSAEALSCGTPVVAVNATANKEIAHSSCGLIFDNLSINEILNALKQIEYNTKSYYSNKCRIYAEKMFSMKNNINEYIKLYREIQ